MYIVNNSNVLQPFGVEGELCISGKGLAIGYLNRSKLTAEKFLENPFVTESEKKYNENLQIYKTGDLVKWLPDGNIDFMKRKDNQVKIRGFRIELGEIESALVKYPAIRQCVVMIQDEKSDDKKLAAYYVVNEKYGKNLYVEEIHQFLKTQIPSYMIPSYFIKVDKIPLTLNGKVDKKELSVQNKSKINLKSKYMLPQTEIERIMTNIWCNVLELDTIGIHDDFFNLGGHSINATKILSRINEIFKVDCSIKAIFESKTIFKLSTYVNELITVGKKEYYPIVPIDRKQILPLSFGQKRLWFLDYLEGKNNSTYNIPIVIGLKGKLTLFALERGLNEIISNFNSSILYYLVLDVRNKNIHISL